MVAKAVTPMVAPALVAEEEEDWDAMVNQKQEKDTPKKNAESWGNSPILESEPKKWKVKDGPQIAERKDETTTIVTPFSSHDYVQIHHKIVLKATHNKVMTCYKAK